MQRPFRTARRAVFASFVISALAIASASPASATPLLPFIDLQEAGLTPVQDGVGLRQLGSGTASLTVVVGGSVRFALLYWAGRDRPAPLSGGDCVVIPMPYKDQQMVFNGTPLTGTLIGNECQATANGGPVNNIGYFADVTSLVAAAGTGSHTFTLADGNLGSNLWALDGATLFVAYTNAADPTTYRLQVNDGLDFARANAGAPANQTTAPITFNHGASTSARSADLFLAVGHATARRSDSVTISNNATLQNQLDRDDGPSWDAEPVTIAVPAGVGSTTVQVNSVRPTPDLLLWEMAAIRVPIVP